MTNMFEHIQSTGSLKTVDFELAGNPTSKQLLIEVLP